MMESELTLVERAQCGDHAAFEELVRRCSRLVFARLYLETGDTQEFTLGAGRFASEAPVAPRIGSTREDDGYLASFFTDESTGTSECILLDAAHLADGPVVRIALPHKLCSGTHSCWADRTRLV